MPHRDRRIAFFTTLLVAGLVQPGLGAPPFELAEDGRTFVYRARPGEPPSSVAESFGVPQDRLGAFLTANGIADATRVPLGFEYRIPNPLVPRLDALTDQVQRLERDVADRSARVAELERTNERLGRDAARSQAKEDRLEALERRWPIAMTALVLALLGLAGALWVTWGSIGRLAAAEQRMRALDHELESRRQAALAERQESSRRIVELENRVRLLEIPRRAGGRS
jgi:hypothetical protein